MQVIPWAIEGSDYMARRGYPDSKYPAKLSTDTTIFVGALHGMLNAEGLACVMEELFGPVIYASIDTDKHKYPIGRSLVYVLMQFFDPFKHAACVKISNNMLFLKLFPISAFSITFIHCTLSMFYLLYIMLCFVILQ